MPYQQTKQQKNQQNGTTYFSFANGMVYNIPPEVGKQGMVRYMKNFQLWENFPRPTKIRGYETLDGEADSANTEELIWNLFFLRDMKNDKGRILAMRDNSGDAKARLISTPLDTLSWSAVKTDMDAGDYYQVAPWLFQTSSGDSGWLYLCNGTSAVKTDGQNAYDIGNSAPGSAPSASAGSAGNIDGTTKIAVSYDYGKYGRSNLGPTTTISVTDKEIDLTSIPTGGSNVQQRVIWRTDERTWAGEEEEIFFETLIINDNSTTTATLTDVGDVILAAPQEPDDKSVPPSPAVIERYAERMFYAGGGIKDGRIYYSNKFLPDEIRDPANAANSTEIDDVGAQEGNDIVAMQSAQNQLYIVTNKSIWVLQGRGFKNWQLRRVHSKGTYSPRTCRVINGMLYFLGNDFEGIYRTNGRKLQNITSGNEAFFREMDPQWAKRAYAVVNPMTKEYKIGLHSDAYTSGGAAQGE